MENLFTAVKRESAVDIVIKQYQNSFSLTAVFSQEINSPVKLEISEGLGVSPRFGTGSYEKFCLLSA